MEIGIIGAGRIGGTLARKLAERGHRVRLANSKAPTTLVEFATANLTPMWAIDAARGADIVILSVPQASIATMADDLVHEVAAAPVVIDTGNYYPARDDSIAALDEGLTDSGWVAHRLGRPVYKVFNNIAAQSLANPPARPDGERLGLTIAGPSGESKATVSALVKQLGFDPVDAGTIEDSWKVQPGTPTYCKNMSAAELRAGISATSHADQSAHRSERDRVDFAASVMKQALKLKESNA